MDCSPHRPRVDDALILLQDGLTGLTEDDGGNGESLKILQNLFSYKISLFRISFDHTFNAIDFTHPDPDRHVLKTFFCENNAFPVPPKAFDWELGKLQELAAESNWVLGEAEKMNPAFEMCELQKVELIPPLENSQLC